MLVPFLRHFVSVFAMAMANPTPAMIFLAKALLQTVRGCPFGWVPPQTEPTVTPTAGEALEDI